MRSPLKAALMLLLAFVTGHTGVGVADAAPRPTVTLSTYTAEVGDMVSVDIKNVTGARRCSLQLTGPMRKSLGTVPIAFGSGYKVFYADGLAEGTYTVQAKCGRVTATSRELKVTEPGLSEFDIDEIKTYASRIVRDMAELDIRVQDGIMVASRMSMLADHYFDLQEAAVPPGADPADYKARCQTLGRFTEMAADEYSYGDDLAGYARYQVIKQETAPLFDIINKAFGTSYQVP